MDRTVTTEEGDKALAKSVASWLMARRAAFADRARANNWALTVTVPVPIAEVSTSGVRSDTEPRQVSLLYYPETLHPVVYATTTRPLIDAAGEELARSLVGAFGARVRYLCYLSPAVIRQDLEHPELLQDGPLPSPGPAAPQDVLLNWPLIFYVLALLRQAVLEYVAVIPSLGQDSTDIAQRIAEQLVVFCAATNVTHLGRVPLSGLAIDGDAVEAGPCSLHRLNREELGYLEWRRHSTTFQMSRVARRLPGAVYPDQFISENLVLEVREEAPKTVAHSAALATQKMLLALQLSSIDFSGAGFGAMLREPMWALSVGQSFHPLLMPRRPLDHSTRIDNGRLKEVLDLSAVIPSGAVMGPKSPPELALRRYALGLSREDPGEALVDYTVALEALLLSGGDMGEARQRFALNGAVFLGASSGDRNRLYQELLGIYRARSILVHGVSPDEPRAKKVLENLGEIRGQARAISCASLHRALTSGWPSEDTFVGALLDDPASP